MTLLAILATAFGIGEGLFALPQAFKIFKRKSAKDISILTFSFQLISVIIWFFYGLEINDLPIIISNIFAIISISIIILGWFLYGRKIK